MSESELYGAIIGTYSRANTRLFRTNSGMAWQGTVIERTPTRLVLAHPRPLHMGVTGMSDLIGWTTSNGLAIYTAIECKGPRTRITDEQQAFIELVRRSGGHAGIARSVPEAGKIILGEY